MVNPETKQEVTEEILRRALHFTAFSPPVMKIQGGDLIGTGTNALEGRVPIIRSEISAGLKFDAPGPAGMANRGMYFDQNDSQFFIRNSAIVVHTENYTVWGSARNGDVVKFDRGLLPGSATPKQSSLAPVHIQPRNRRASRAHSRRFSRVNCRQIPVQN